MRHVWERNFLSSRTAGARLLRGRRSLARIEYDKVSAAAAGARGGGHDSRQWCLHPLMGLPNARVTVVLLRLPDGITMVLPNSRPEP